MELVDIAKITRPLDRLSVSFSEAEWSEFRRSIAEGGVVVPVVLMQDYDGKLLLGEGEHRIRAVQEAGGKMIPAIIMRGGELEAISTAVKLNTSRGHVKPADLIKTVATLYDKLKSERSVAEKIGRTKSWVSRLLKIARSPVRLRQLEQGKLTLTEAYELADPKTSKRIGSIKKALACVWCGKPIKRGELGWLPVHSDCKQGALIGIPRRTRAAGGFLQETPRLGWDNPTRSPQIQGKPTEER